MVSANKRQKKSRLDKDARIAIVGSGLGGLGAARSLEQAGFTNIVLYERDESMSSRREGYGLTLTYNPKGPLAQMGLLEEVARHDCPSRSHYLFAPDGTILGYYGNAFLPNRGKGQRGNLRVPRQVLRQLLLDHVSSPVQWGKKLVSFHHYYDDNVSHNPKLRLQFENGDIVDDVDLLVGADGIRSVVVRNLLSHRNDDLGGPRYLGIMIILGIADFCHPLLDERGFYTLDGTHRLFTMPYEGSQLDNLDDNGNPSRTGKQRRIMWQLSYRLEDQSEATRLSTLGPESLRDEVLRRCKDWHDPVVSMVNSTPLSTIWGTGLMDQDPEELLEGLDPVSSARVVVLGDAIHSMSPFKGQGANQALTDGPLLASWMQRASADSAVRGFMREMVKRTAQKVRASREAADTLHSPRVLAQSHDFAGVKSRDISHLLCSLRKKQIGAAKAHLLDRAVQEEIDNLGLTAGDEKQSLHIPTVPGIASQVKALEYAAKGDTHGLRSLSLKHADAIRAARDEKGRSCLHLAILGGFYYVCRWLVAEAFVSLEHTDDDGRNPMEVADLLGNERIISLLSVASRD